VEMTNVTSGTITQRRYCLCVIIQDLGQMDLCTCLIIRPSVHTILNGRRLLPACHSGLILVTAHCVTQQSDVVWYIYINTV